MCGLDSMIEPDHKVSIRAVLVVKHCFKVLTGGSVCSAGILRGWGHGVEGGMYLLCEELKP